MAATKNFHPNHMPKISACLVVYNEEKFIERCLSSLQGKVDEIIVVHDGECADKTLAIARELSARIFIRPRAGFMEAHLPFCLEQAKGDWILRIDADEYLSDELKNNLRRLASGDQAEAYEFLWPISDGKKYLTEKWPRKMCLFKKNKISFLGIVHYLPAVNGEIRTCDYVLRHEPGYNNFSWPIFKNKWIRWAKLQAENYFFDFKDINKYNYPGKGWPTKIKLRKKFPLLLLPFEFFSVFFKTLTKSGFKDSFVYRAALMNASYRVLVNYYIFLKTIGK